MFYIVATKIARPITYITKFGCSEIASDVTMKGGVEVVAVVPVREEEEVEVVPAGLDVDAPEVDNVADVDEPDDVDADEDTDDVAEIEEDAEVTDDVAEEDNDVDIPDVEELAPPVEPDVDADGGGATKEMLSM